MGNDKDVKDSAQSLLSRPILVPLDGTDVAEGILPYVSEVAKKGNVPLLLLGVVDPRGIHYPPSTVDRPAGETSEPGAGGAKVDDPASKPKGETPVLYRDQIENATLANVVDELEAVAGGLRGKGITVSVRSSIGSPAEEVLRVAEEEGCGIIAMSTHGRNAIARGILGSVTDRVVHASTLPVLTVTPERAKEYLNLEGASLSTVMVPLDGSDLSERALPYAVELARSLSLELLLVRAVTLDSSSYAYGGYFDLTKVSPQVVPEATDYLDDVAEGLKRQGVRARFKVLRGSAPHALLSFAQETPNALIAMTTHGRSGLTRWLMGSVGEAMVRASSDPVLTIPSTTQR